MLAQLAACPVASNSALLFLAICRYFFLLFDVFSFSDTSKLFSSFGDPILFAVPAAVAKITSATILKVEVGNKN